MGDLAVKTRTFFQLLFLCIVVALPVVATEGEAETAPETEEQKVFYAIGLAMSRNLQSLADGLCDVDGRDGPVRHDVGHPYRGPHHRR